LLTILKKIDYVDILMLMGVLERFAPATVAAPKAISLKKISQIPDIGLRIPSGSRNQTILMAGMAPGPMAVPGISSWGAGATAAGRSPGSV
jgi:hypothetical protein